MNNVEHRYQYDATFNQVVDQLRYLLSSYHITPGELREATMLAATMHEAENIRPLFIRRSDPTPPFQQHVYAEWHDGLYDSKWRMCVRCQMSSTYIEHNKLTTCTGRK